MSLRRFSQRAMFSRPGRTLLTIASIVIGVAAVVAVTVVTATTRESYDIMFAAVRGKTSLEIVAQNTGPIPEDLVGKVAALVGVEGAVPLVQRPSSLTKGEQRVRLQVLGIDPDKDKLVREMEVVDGRLLKPNDGDKILLEAEFAAYLGFKVGDVITVYTKSLRPMEVVGLIKIKDASALTQTGLVFMPVKQAATRFLGKNDRGESQISSVQIVAKSNADLADLQSRIQPMLPDGVEVREPKGSAQVLEETLLSTEKGLTLTTAFTLLLAGFIILNTFLMNVGERRRQLAIMRAVGATRGQIAWMLVGESLVLATIGTAVGILLGLGLSAGLISALSKLLDISLPSPVQFMLNYEPYMWAVVFGFAVSVVGALFPAFRAWKVSPLEGLSHVSKQDMTRVPPIHILIGFIVSLIGGGLIAAGIMGYVTIDVPQYGAVLLMVGIVLMYPLVLAPLSHLSALLVKWRFRVETNLALKQILRHRGRTSLTVGVLFIAGATGVAMAHSILDNVQNLKDWYRRALIGDYYIRAMLPDMATGLSADLPEELDPELQNVSGIAYLDRVKMVEAQATVVSRRQTVDPQKDPPEELNIILAIRQFHEPGKVPFDLISGDPEAMRQQMQSGEVVIGNIAANKLQVGQGDTLEIGGGEGKHRVRICGVTNDYLVGGLTLYMDWETGKRLMKTPGVDGYIMRAEKDQLLALKPKLEKITKKYGVLLNSQAEIGHRIDQISNGISGCLWGLIFLGFVVAAFGVVNTLSMNVLEQTRELGLLRIVAMTRRQVQRTIIIQALIIGAVGLLPGVAGGLAIAYIINLAMGPTLGRPIEFNYHPVLMFSTLIGAMIVTVIAAAIPARRAARVDLAQALHYE